MSEFKTAIVEASESEYLRLLQARLQESGEIGDVFDWMVMRNVPMFVLKQLWPERYEAQRRNFQSLTFAVAEPGWRGRIENVKSEARPAAGGGAQLNLLKNYVMSASVVLSLVRSGEGFALVWLNGDGGLVRRARDEPDLSLPRSDGSLIQHFILEGETTLAADEIRPTDRAAYARLGVQIPRREFTSLALIAPALLARAGASLPPELKAAETELLRARDSGRLGGQETRLAKQLLAHFFTESARLELKLHPIWERMRKTLSGE